MYRTLGGSVGGIRSGLAFLYSRWKSIPCGSGWEYMNKSCLLECYFLKHLFICYLLRFFHSIALCFSGVNFFQNLFRNIVVFFSFLVPNLGILVKIVVQAPQNIEFVLWFEPHLIWFLPIEHSKNECVKVFFLSSFSSFSIRKKKLSNISSKKFSNIEIRSIRWITMYAIITISFSPAKMEYCCIERYSNQLVTSRAFWNAKMSFFSVFIKVIKRCINKYENTIIGFPWYPLPIY